MKLQAIISSAALAAALTFSSGAIAQNMIGGMEVPTERLNEFQDACAALRAESTASLTTEDPDIDATTTGSTPGGESAQATSPDPASQEHWDTIMAGLTLEQCDEGFPAAM